MKKSLITLAVVGASALSLFGQGTIDFRNGTGQLADPPDRRVRTVEGAPLVGTQFVAGLFFASDANNPSASLAFTEAVAPFRIATTTQPGFWNPPGGASRTLIGVGIGQTANLVVRVWDTSIGSYAQAVASGRVNAYGQSQPFSYTVPSSPTADPTEFYMRNFLGFSLVPEPSTIALGILGGIGTLVLLRRRK